MKKSVGIITFHKSRNYGAVLQAFALQQKMSELFENVEIIDYQNSEIAKVVKFVDIKGKGIKALAAAVLRAVFRFNKNSAFNSYMKKYMRLSAQVDRNSIKNYCDKYDVLITGSDQVWNIELTGNDETYFLDFADDSKTLASYAASFGDSEPEISDSLKSMLKRFDIITLREKIMLEKVQTAIQKDIYTCCDPTLLIAADEWRGYASKRLSKKPYVFMFVIDEAPELSRYARKIAEEKGMKLVSNKNDLSFFRHPRPDEFLSWILNADYVITNSFHGTVFSLLFNKKFAAHMYTASDKPKKRIMELLSDVGLEHRNTRNTAFDIDCQEDWKKVDSKISEIRKSSWSVIENYFENN